MVKNYRMEKDHTAIIRERLAAAFEEQNATLRKVADYCGVEPQAVHKWKKTGKIKRDNVPKISKFFGKRPDWLLEDMPDAAAETTADYLKEPMPVSFRELADAMSKLPTQTRHDIHNLIRDLAKILRR